MPSAPPSTLPGLHSTGRFTEPVSRLRDPPLDIGHDGPDFGQVGRRQVAGEFRKDRLHVGSMLTEEHGDVVLVVLDPGKSPLPVERRQREKLEQKQALDRRADDVALHESLVACVPPPHEFEQRMIAEHEVYVQSTEFRPRERVVAIDDRDLGNPGQGIGRHDQIDVLRVAAGAWTLMAMPPTST